MAGQGGLSQGEAIHLGALAAILPVAMYGYDGLPRDQAKAARLRLNAELLTKVWGAQLGDPTGPSQTYRPEDLAAISLVGGMISAQVARHGRP